MRILLSILISIAPILGYAQTTGKIIEANAALGIASQPNYVINSNAENNLNNITATNIDTFTRVDVGTSANSVIDGKWSFLVNDDGNTGIIRFAANPMNSGKSGQNCSAFVRYQLDSLGDPSNNWSIVVEDASNNEISPRVRLTDTWNSLLGANPGISGLAIIPGYPCKAGQQNVFALKHLAAVSSQLIFDEVHVIDYPYPTSVPQGAEFFGGMEQIGGASYAETTSTSLSNFVTLGAGTGGTAWTTDGNITAVGTNDHRALMSNIGPAYYQVVITGSFTALASGNCLWRLSDGTNTYQAQFGPAGTTATQLQFSIKYASSQTPKTLSLEAADDQASGCRFGDSTPTAIKSWKVYKFPLTGSSNTVVPASCINNPDCQNNFSAKVSSAGVVSDEDYSFINGNASISSTSIYALTWDSSRFSVAPTCTATIANSATAVIFQEITTSTTGVSIRILASTTGAALAASFHIRCSRAGTDVKPWGPIPWLTGMESNDLPTSQRNVSFEFAGAASSTTNCTSNPCTVRNSSLAGITVAWVSAGVQTVTFPANTWRSVDDYTCLPGLINFAGANGPAITAQKVSATSMTVTCTAAGVVNCAGVLKCWGPR